MKWGKKLQRKLWRQRHHRVIVRCDNCGKLSALHKASVGTATSCQYCGCKTGTSVTA